MTRTVNNSAFVAHRWFFACRAHRGLCDSELCVYPRIVAGSVAVSGRTVKMPRAWAGVDSEALRISCPLTLTPFNFVSKTGVLRPSFSHVRSSIFGL